ncbi:MAG: hypothetical protein Sapg2KO_53340 [Saprospiraceae bacterium]
MLSFAFACQSASTTIAPTKLENTFLKERNQTNPKIRGIWKSIGNGYFLEVKIDSIKLYSYTESFCYKEKNDYLEGLLNSQSQFVIRGDTIGVYLTYYGSSTQNLQTKKDFYRIEKLPENCLTFEEMLALDNKKLFNLYQEHLQENYAFAEKRKLDWASIFNSFQDSLLADEQALFESIGNIATLTKDQHTKVIATDGTSRQYRVTPSALIVQSAFEDQTEVKDLNEYFNLFFTQSKRHITDSLLLGKGEKVANGNLEWGKINEEVGYIHISSFAGFLNKDFTRAQQIDSINRHMDRIIEALQNTEAIIVDVSFNFGGYDAAGLTIASYFTDEARLAYISEVYNKGIFYQEDEVVIYPSGKAYTKPVYVLMTDISRSAAESFAMMMDALPNVKLVGTHTLGTLSGMLGKSVSNFYVTYSNQRLVNSQGAYFEASGVQPDIELTVFPKEDVMRGHMNAVRAIVDRVDYH